MKQYNWEPFIISLFPDKIIPKDNFFADQIPDDVEVFCIDGEKRFKKIKRFFSHKDKNAIGLNSTKASKNILKALGDRSFNAFITDGPPHEMHFIGKKLKGNLDIPWIVDFTFGWFTEIQFSDTTQRTKVEKVKQHFESEILPLCDYVITGSNKLASQFIEIGFEKVEIITDGYDYNIQCLERSAGFL